jgi:hypothetical protein
MRMPKYSVFVVGQVEETFTIEAADPWDAQAAAEMEFIEKFTCIAGGLDVGFDAVDAYDAEEI